MDRYEEALERAKAGKPMDEVFPELKESEDERIRSALIRGFNSMLANQPIGTFYGEPIKDIIAYLEKQKEQVLALRLVVDGLISDPNAHFELVRVQNPIEDVIKDITKNKESATKFLKSAGIMDDNGELAEMYRSEQKPAESDSIKGGDFISDGKRVFLVLANVEERNFGEIGSTFCEGLILGIDGAVYCNGDDFKKYKRATSGERAKFIHNLKVGVELKEQPVEWSEEDNKAIHLACEFIRHHATKGDSIGGIDCSELVKRLKSLRPQPKAEWSKEDKKMLEAIVGDIHCGADFSAEVIHEANKREKWLRALRPQPKAELTLLDKNIINAAVAFVEQNDHFNVWGGIDKHTVIKALRSLKPHWKPSEEQMEALRIAYEIGTANESWAMSVLKYLYDDLKKLM